MPAPGLLIKEIDVLTCREKAEARKGKNLKYLDGSVMWKIGDERWLLS